MEQDLVAQVSDLMARGYKDWFISRELGVTRDHARRLMQQVKTDGDAKTRGVSVNYGSANAEISGVVRATARSQSLAALLHDAEVDLSVWRVTRWVANMWGQPGNPCWQVKAWLERIPQQEARLEDLIQRLEAASPVIDPRPYPELPRQQSRRALEISVMDPHFGLRSFSGPSGDDYNPKIAKEIYVWSIAKLMERSLPFGPFDRICFVTGNDFMHADNVFHTTTAGTVQPEMDSWHSTFDYAEELLCETVARLANYAPVHVVMVPGNHARQSEHALGRIVRAFFRNDPNVTVDAGSEPYKFWNFGVNLIGFEHGHSIKPERLPALMANERADLWPSTWCREWHCGDQHRESVTFSEFGVNVKFLPSMVPWNEWHKIKGLSWQRRSSVGFVYDHDCGLISTPQVNLSEVRP